MAPSRRIPQVPSLPVLGNAWSLASDAPSFFLQEHRLRGSVFSFRAVGRKFVVLAGRQANLFASRQGADCFSSGAFWAGLCRAYGSKQTMISRDGPDHAALRKAFARGYSRSCMEGKMQQLTELSLAELAKHSKGEAKPVHALIQRLVTLQLGYLTAGRAGLDMLPYLNRFLRTTLASGVTQQRPKFLLHTPKYRRAQAKVKAFALELLAAASPEDNNLMGQTLALHRDRPDLLPDHELISCALSPFAAGLDTAASTIAFALYHLSKRPGLLAQIREQGDTFFDQGARVKDLATSDLAYRTILETLRCNPIAPALSRVTTREFAFNGYAIPARQPVIIATTVTHFDPIYFPNPGCFDLGRYNAPRQEHRQAGVYVPFGVGPHTCLGAGMAKALMIYNLLLIAHACDTSFSSTQGKLAVHQVPSPRPADSFQVALTPRKSDAKSRQPVAARQLSLVCSKIPDKDPAPVAVNLAA